MSSIKISIIAGLAKDTAFTKILGFLTILSKGLSLLYLPLFTLSSTYQQIIIDSLIPSNY